MNRRQILATLGTGVVALGGCLEEVDLPGNPSGFPELSVEEVKDRSEDDLELSVEVVEQFDASFPAELRISLTNLLDTDRDFMFGPAPPFNDFWGFHEETGAVLLIVPYIVIDDESVAGRSLEDVERQYHDHVYVRNRTDPTGDHSLVPDEPIDNCWRSRNPVDRTDVGLHLEMDPGETITEEYIVLANWDNEPCLPDGTYRFGTSNPSDRDETHSGDPVPEISLAISSPTR